MRFELFIQTWRFTFALEGFSEAIWVSGKEMKIMNQSQPFTNEILSESLIWSWQQQRKGPLVMVTLAVWVFAGGLLRSGTQGAWHSWKVSQSRDGILETEFICLRVQVPEKNLLHKSTMFSVDSHSWLIHTNDLFILFPLEGENKSNSNLANNHHWICCPKGLFQSSLSFRSKKKKVLLYFWGFPGGSDSKGSACNVGDPGLIPGQGRSSGEEHGNPLQYSCLGNSMDGGAWQAGLSD